MEYGCEKKVTQFSNLSASIAVCVPSGVTLKLRLVLLRLVLVFTRAFNVYISSSHCIHIDRQIDTFIYIAPISQKTR